MIDEVQCRFDPMESEYADIFKHELAKNFYTQYRRWHIISQNGLPFLVEVARELIKNNTKFDEKSAETFLQNFHLRMNNIEWSTGDGKDWIEKTVPYMTGKSSIKLVQVPEDSI